MDKRSFFVSRQFLIVNISAWLLIFALTVSESLFFYQINQREVPYRNIIVNDLFILCWIPISPILFLIIRQWYRHRINWLNFAFKIFAIGMGTIALVIAMESTIHYFDRINTEQFRSWTNIYVQLISLRFHSNFILYLGFTAISVATVTFSESKRMKENQAALSKSLMEAQLGVLKAQMKPHFLFNSLHAISGLILKQQNDLAITVIAKLSDLLRDSLNMDNKKWITLKEELDFIKRYLEIYVLRFGDQLTYSIEVGKDVEEVSVPPALLQPIVENALVHSIIPNDNQGHIAIKAWRRLDNLCLSILDNGHATTTQPLKEGLGLGNTRKRLFSLYGDQFTLEFDSGQQSEGPSMQIIIPISKTEI